ncbi:hypothetical protein X743_30335 [Mesorhizobium sp. LNHC252B00]|nr:hypothetical protein X743_30335 [Mesorhizobium sp. LNHC252B00]
MAGRDFRPGEPDLGRIADDPITDRAAADYTNRRSGRAGDADRFQDRASRDALASNFRIRLVRAHN